MGARRIRQREEHMRIKATVLKLDDQGDSIRVTAQGRAKIDATWQPMRLVQIDVPVHIGRRWRIGQRLNIQITTET